MFRSRGGGPGHKSKNSNIGYEYLGEQGISGEDGSLIFYLPVLIPARLVALYRNWRSRRQTWLQVLPEIAVLLSASFFVYVVFWTLHHIKISGILKPAYRTVPLVTPAQIEAATSRHLTHDQCLASFPRLYECVKDRRNHVW